ncbi:uncharacterized protein CLUP02_02781 [Colletotrichum lupini]|uniref:Uncharacterized protein n=1 Tax=Colletotrichum lupini TaxID=145971 RepID=A0A9Q8SH66_9PEZI|nr:uncharacterized protein CLUP02_02781 [Colletotrichum lupini]UQC77314.1 hypothetical protein CLUP02_02781 [Colletotrichum lupini]
MAVFDIVWYALAGFGQPLQCDGSLHSEAPATFFFLVELQPHVFAPHFVPPGQLWNLRSLEHWNSPTFVKSSPARCDGAANGHQAKTHSRLNSPMNNRRCHKKIAGGFNNYADYLDNPPLTLPFGSAHTPQLRDMSSQQTENAHAIDQTPSNTTHASS